MSYYYYDISPCKGCTFETGRSEICHCTCYKYIAYKEEGERRLAELKTLRETSNAVVEHVVNTITKMQKNHATRKRFINGGSIH